MITVETQPGGGGHRDDGEEEEIQKVTNKHHQRGESSQQGHAVLVRSEVERLEAHRVREECTAWCKTQTSDLTVAVETGREEKVDLKGEFCSIWSDQRLSPDQDP